ncbi:MAG: hypothetical protein ACTSRX_09175 [Promethearchaeota archaeon]
MKINSNSAIAIDSVEEEYRYIQQISCDQCESKGSFKLDLQSLIFEENQPYDKLDCQCENCRAKKSFIFDISSFFGKLF